ncbi:phospholipase D family protein [Pseudomonas amygdali]|uniref:phospholipase D family nuclease n=1 Tax=Pseudomonas syringae group genomosp. 2 TaxID=251698 RepID=UPI000E328B8B|nr:MULTISPECIES: phospholipase D family protein [Pseudomonas syringae group genomosp. 2]MBI6727609.1 phospholipase D family protein [Pseudomonas amygdali]MBI6814089.1 phospholipase D family protein [Pseudomonas amygdali]
MTALSALTRSFSRGLVASVLLCNLTFTVQAAEIQVGFSPEGSAEQLVLNVIQRARQQIRLMAYSFTSPSVVKALVQAKRRGVDVQVVVDAHGNDNRASRAAMNLLANAQIPVRTNGAYKIQHDKVIITDDQNVETGSFNYSASAAKANSENAVVMWDAPAVASVYLEHWQSRWVQGQPYQPTY